jgi:hypothetical protein
VKQIPTREMCKLCHSVNRVGFIADSAVWEAVVPEPFRDSVVCLGCFTRIADEKLIAWEDEMEFFPISLASVLRDDGWEPSP